MSVCYVIATYDGETRTKRSHSCPTASETLKAHIEKLNSLNHNLSEIIVMRADSSDAKVRFPGYYESARAIYPSSTREIPVENYGYSMGQWLKAYELTRGKHDYYLFTEDDYCPLKDNFDDVFLKIYKSKFPCDIGLLCTLVEGNKMNQATRRGYPIHWSGDIFLSKESLERLYTCKKWEGKPREWLDKLDSKNAWPGMDQVRKGYLGGYYQLGLSQLFIVGETGVRHEDYLDVRHEDELLTSPYWTSSEELCFYDKGDLQRNRYTLQDIRNGLIGPVQVSKDAWIEHHTGLALAP